MTTTTLDLQIFPLCNCSECIIKVERTLCGIDGVKLLYVDHQNAKFTIETTRDPKEIRDALQHMFVGMSVLVSRRIKINPPNPSVQRPLDFNDVAREMVEGSRGKGLVNVEYTQSTTIKMNYTDQPTTSRSPTNVHGGYGYANAAPPPQQYPPTTYGSTWPYGRYSPPPASAPPMPKTEGEGYVYGYPSEKKYMEDNYYSGACSNILLYLFYGILVLFLVTSIKTE